MKMVLSINMLVIFFYRHKFRGRSSKNLQQKLLHDILNSSEKK